jgi:putative Holliday junction resolvase
MRILAVDPGEKRLGIALSDPTGTIATPLSILTHTSRQKDAESIAALAVEHDVERIVVGQPLDIEGEVGYQGRKSARLAGAIRGKTEIPVVLWDEHGSTQAAQQSQIKIGTPKNKRAGHLDDLAAVVILQSYLDSQSE